MFQSPPVGPVVPVVPSCALAPVSLSVCLPLCASLRVCERTREGTWSLTPWKLEVGSWKYSSSRHSYYESAIDLISGFSGPARVAHLVSAPVGGCDFGGWLSRIGIAGSNGSISLQSLNRRPFSHGPSEQHPRPSKSCSCRLQ
jgi:hypothetical protein